MPTIGVGAVVVVIVMAVSSTKAPLDLVPTGVSASESFGTEIDVNEEQLHKVINATVIRSLPNPTSGDVCERLSFL